MHSFGGGREKDVSIAHFPSSQSFSPEKSVQRFLGNGTRRKDNIKTFIEGGAKLVKHRVSTRSCGMSAFIDSRRSQFSLSLSLSPRNRAPLGHHLLSPLSHSPSNPVAFTVAIPLRENQRWLPRQHFNVVPSLAPSLFLHSRYTQKEDDARGLFAEAIYTAPFSLFLDSSFGIISSKIIRIIKNALKEGKARVYAL